MIKAKVSLRCYFWLIILLTLFLHIDLKFDITYLKFSMELKYKKRLDII